MFRCAVVLMVLVSGSLLSAETLRDDFDDGILSPAWQVVTQSGGTSWDESGGTLNVGGSSGQVGELVMRYNQPFDDVGSVCIDYNWTAYSGHKARVGLILADASLTGFDPNNQHGIYIKGVRYRSTGLHAVDGGGTSAGYQIIYSVPTSGSLMIERDGDNFQASYLDGGAWKMLFEGQHDFGETLLYPYLFTSNSNTNPRWEVALDNFYADVAPEPSSLVLLIIGASSLLVCTWRRNQIPTETRT
ncbi:hypothetical protein LCGC14_0428870 [marine sediment metagenome]|uniref:PEP-CTERM protein-sorting domain-containing protein n=1 Tax=marine sediment metagenome TaxID=412755 RepID=A0A0F9SUP2_9ZZZZ